MKFPSIPTTVLFSVLFFSATAYSQPNPVGGFTATNNGSQLRYPTPYADNPEAMRTQFLYRAAELQSAGYVAGWITHVGFYVENLNGIAPIEKFKILAGTTTNNNLNNWIPSLTQVFGPVDYQPVTGLNLHTLQTPIFWNGSSNLVIQICNQQPPTGGGQTQDAWVRLTDTLSIDGSRTFTSNNYNSTADICADNGTGSGGPNQEVRPVLYLRVCPAPTQLIVTNTTSNSATISWTNPIGGVTPSLEYAIGPSPFTPGVTGTSITAGATTASITGLSGSTTYQIYLRNNCGNGSVSDWGAPVTFTTLPSCGDAVNYPSDLLPPFTSLPALYEANLNWVRTLCPDEPQEAITVSLNYFITGANDLLTIYNGASVTDPVLATLSGIQIPIGGTPGEYTASTASGCLTFEFKTDANQDAGDIGWYGTLSCAPAPECYKPLDVTINGITTTTASAKWVEMFGATGYSYLLHELPAGPDRYGTATQGAVNLSNLAAGTMYEITVRSFCGADSSGGVTTAFTTPIDCSGPAIECGTNGAETQVRTSGQGLWQPGNCFGLSPGKERLFTFTAPHTRTYTFDVTNSPISGPVSYYIKDTGSICNSAGWRCINSYTSSIESPTALAINGTKPLEAGRTYYILADPQTTALVDHRFRIYGCTAVNDDLFAAIELTVNDPCRNFSNSGSTTFPGEPSPHADGIDQHRRWQTPANETVWFKFTAPESETVTIITQKASGMLANSDPQVALYALPNPNDPTTLDLLISDEDNGNTGFLGYDSELSYSGLTPGETYYIQVDGHGPAAGVFCIAVLEAIDRVSNANCSNTYLYTGVDGTDWLNLYSLPNPPINDPEVGQVVLAINPQGNDLDTLTVSANNFSDVPVAADSRPYMPLTFGLTSSSPLPPGSPIQLRMFFSKSDFDALKAAAGLPMATIDQLYVSFFPNSNPNCVQHDNGVESSLLPGAQTVLLVADSSFYIEVPTTQLGEFYVHFGATALPLELTSFTAYAHGDQNRLEWITASERDVRHFAVERAVNPAGSWTEIGRVASLGDHTGGARRYSFDDPAPPLRAYYRLRAEDLDGTTTLSNIATVTRTATRLTALRAFPTPTDGALWLELIAPARQTVRLLATDVDGRTVLDQSRTIEAGQITLSLDLTHLPAGLYTLSVFGETEVAGPVRVVVGN